MAPVIGVLKCGTDELAEQRLRRLWSIGWGDVTVLHRIGWTQARRLACRYGWMTAIRTLFTRCLVEMLDDEAGQTMAEYGLLIAVIAIVVVIAAVTLGGGISSLFGSTSGQL